MTGPEQHGLPRRGALLLLGGAVLSGCAAAAHPSPVASPSRTDATPAPGPTPPALPRVRPWQPGPGELEPGCKRAAVRAIEQRGTGARVATEVIDAQYGGLLTDSASVLVVTRSYRIVGDRVVAGGHTDDVRLTRTPAGDWQVRAEYPSRPGPATPRISRAARRVLANDRIDLPPAARADVASGLVHDSVLTAMLDLAGSYRIGISVLRSGHPLYVFGTTRLSDHPRGRAFDTWRINDRAVVDPDTPAALVSGYMRAVADLGAYNVGGPVLLGPAPQYFSDRTHHDHVHAGFTD